MEIDKQKWINALNQPNWYEILLPEFNELELLASKEADYHKRKAIKNQAYQIIEDALNNNIIRLAEKGLDFDTERLPIDTVVIHHTANLPGMHLQRLNAIQLLRIYSRKYYNDITTRGLPVWSGHFYHGRQVFWGYHWFIKNDGSVIKLLDNTAIGWHAGDWNINRRSIGICFDDDLTNKEPTPEAIFAVNEILGSYKHFKLIGHKDVNPSTSCPGSLFESNWKVKFNKN